MVNSKLVLLSDIIVSLRDRPSLDLNNQKIFVNCHSSFVRKMHVDTLGGKLSDLNSACLKVLVQLQGMLNAREQYWRDATNGQDEIIVLSNMV